MNSETKIFEKSLNLLMKRCDAATAGPWKPYIEGRDHESGSSFIMASGNDIELSSTADADQDFIAHARKDVPRLVEDPAGFVIVTSL